MYACLFTGTSGAETSTSSIEQEKYFSALVAATPLGNPRFDQSASDSLTSLDSLILSAGGETLTIAETTPDISRKTLIARAVGGLRSSGGRVKCKHAKGLSLDVGQDCGH